MTEKQKQKINYEILKLPKEMQEVINSVDWINNAGEIGKKFSLSDNEIVDLQTETGLALVGLTDLALYTTNVEDNIGVTSDDAKKITLEAFDKIFTPIADKIELLIKSQIKSKNIKWEQTIDFITSGGDYSAFL